MSTDDTDLRRNFGSQLNSLWRTPELARDIGEDTIGDARFGCELSSLAQLQILPAGKGLPLVITTLARLIQLDSLLPRCAPPADLLSPVVQLHWAGVEPCIQETVL